MTKNVLTRMGEPGETTYNVPENEEGGINDKLCGETP